MMRTSLLLLTVLMVLGITPAFADEKGETKTWTFEAEIVRVQLLSRFSGSAKLAAIDPRFIAEVRLRENVEGFGKKGTTIALAIHSPSRDLHLEDYAKAAGEIVRLKLSKDEGAKRFSLRRVFEKPKKG